MTVFTLSLAQPHRPSTPTTYSYDPEQQLNVTSAGEPAAMAGGAEMGTATSSTAGSKTHSDDTD